MSAVESAEFLQEEATPVLVAELYKNNIMNALAASIKKNALPRNKRGKRYLRTKHANH
jgi:hypothetical protein